LKLAIFANGILFNNVGGAQRHMREVLERLTLFYDIYYFPEPQAYKNKNKCNSKYVEYLTTLGINVSEYFINYSGNEIEMDKIIEKYDFEIKNCDLIYDLDFQYYIENMKYGGELSLLLSKKADKKLGVCLQDLGDVNMHFLSELYSGYKLARTAPRLSGLIFGISVFDYLNRKLTLRRLISSKNLSFITIVNKSYERNMEIDFKNIYALEPSNAIDTTIQKYSGMEKEDKIIFFARLVYRKGIFDFILIVKEILKHSNLKVLIAGQFHHAYEERYFFKMLSKYHLGKSVEYKGKLTDDELYQELSTAKVMVYPSHSDSFSISILQAIYLKTPVVAYDIAGISVYKEFNCVKFVKEFDIKGMAKMVVETLKDNDINFTDKSLDNFIAQHDNWDKVSDAHRKIIEKYLN
jgi:glycosyltransferase involved in cell wall biosynthesis